MQNAMTEHKDARFPPEESRRSVQAGGEARVNDSLPSSPPERTGRFASVTGMAIEAAEGTRVTAR